MKAVSVCFALVKETHAPLLTAWSLAVGMGLSRLTP